MEQERSEPPDRLQREGEQIKSRDHRAVEYRLIRVGDPDYALDPHTQKSRLHSSLELAA